jgi:hypothetical protein
MILRKKIPHLKNKTTPYFSNKNGSKIICKFRNFQNRRKHRGSILRNLLEHRYFGGLWSPKDRQQHHENDIVKYWKII